MKTIYSLLIINFSIISSNELSFSALLMPDCSGMNQSQCNNDNTCNWVYDISYGSCGSLTVAECYDYPGQCYVDSLPGWYDSSGPYCAGGTYQINNSYCEEILMPDCSSMDQLQCLNEDSCSWIEDYEWSSCSNYNTASECSWANSNGGNCDWSWNSTEWQDTCSGGAFQLDTSYCQEADIIICSEVTEEDECDTSQDCLWYEDISQGSCSDYNSSSACSNANDQCYWDLCYGGSYGSWSHCCRGGTWYEDNSSCIDSDFEEPDCTEGLIINGGYDCHYDSTGYFSFQWTSGCLATSITYTNESGFTQNINIASYGFYDAFIFYGFEPGYCGSMTLFFQDGSSMYTEQCVDCGECVDIDNDSICDFLDDCVGNYDECGICNGDGSSCGPAAHISLSNSNGFEILYSSEEDIYGFQFDIIGDIVLDSAFSGDAEAADFSVQISEGTVLGFSFTGSFIPAGSGILTSLNFEGEGDACMTDLIISGIGGNPIIADIGDGDSNLGDISDDCITLESYLPGDVNDDGDLNILDVVTIVSYILDSQYDIVADINDDGDLNILDIVQIVSIIINR